MARAQSIRSHEPRRQPETPAAVTALSVASGEERPVLSPALQLQEALEEMLSPSVASPPQPGNVLALGVGLAAAAGVCAVFWISLGRMLISLT